MATRARTHLLVVLIAAVLAVLMLAHGASAQTTRHATATRQTQATVGLRHAIVYHRQRAWYWQARAGIPKSPTNHTERRTTSAPFLRWINNRWQHRAAVAYHRARVNARSRARTPSGSDMGAWLCIHRYEGSWSDPGSPYWGGLQMDLTFQQEYGPEFLKRYGTADHWPIIDQIIAARRARDGWHNPYSGRTFSARGYHPWPNTAHLCGLI